MTAPAADIPGIIARIRDELARYACAGPIPITFEVSRHPTYERVVITAVASVPDVDIHRATGEMVMRTVRHTRVMSPHDLTETGEVVAQLVRVAFSHEAAEWLTRDGVVIDDRHRAHPAQKTPSPTA